jgi:CheY-like chemotaxis protein
MKSLVDLHGGRVELRSEGAGRGTEFVVRLPLGDTAHAAAPAPTGRSGRRVLIIEDNADAREMLRMSLALDGHRVDVAEDGPRGVDVALARAPEVVLIDLGLPGLDGYEVARRIRETLGEAVTLVALTGYGQAEDRRRTREAGFDAHFVKPVDPETLSRALNEGFPAAA